MIDIENYIRDQRIRTNLKNNLKELYEEREFIVATIMSSQFFLDRVDKLIKKHESFLDRFFEDSN